MIVLFGVTVLLVGPAWRRPLHVAVCAAVLAAAVVLRLAGVPGLWAAAAAGAFGLAGVAVMLLWSRRAGVMAHCTAICPVGVAATWLGRISPFRLRIDEGCTGCGKCRLACRYDALTKGDIESRRAGISCTLCGDCVGRCENSNIGYRFSGLSPDAARAVFVALADALHAAFLGVARI